MGPQVPLPRAGPTPYPAAGPGPNPELGAVLARRALQPAQLTACHGGAVGLDTPKQLSPASRMPAGGKHTPPGEASEGISPVKPPQIPPGLLLWHRDTDGSTVDTFK